MLRSFFDFLAPPRCALCRELLQATTAKSSRSGAPLCDACRPPEWSASPDNALGEALLGLQHCPVCGELTAVRTGPCVYCEAFPLGVDALLSAFPYSLGFERVLRVMKYGRQAGLLAYLAELLVQWLHEPSQRSHPQLRSLYDGRAVIVPVPSSALRIRERGFFLTAMLARKVGRAFGVPVREWTLALSGGRPAQASLPVHQRFSALSGAVRLARPLPPGRPVLLIDDVITTGSSIESSATALRSGGSCEIVAVTALRSVRFQSSRCRARLRGATPHFR